MHPYKLLVWDSDYLGATSLLPFLAVEGLMVKLVMGNNIRGLNATWSQLQLMMGASVEFRCLLACGSWAEYDVFCFFTEPFWTEENVPFGKAPPCMPSVLWNQII